MEHFPEVQRILESSPGTKIRQIQGNPVYVRDIFLFHSPEQQKNKKHQIENTTNFFNLNPYDGGRRKKYHSNVWAYP
jgi:hypothetical protein